MLNECAQICHLPFLPGRFDFPELYNIVRSLVSEESEEESILGRCCHCKSKTQVSQRPVLRANQHDLLSGSSESAFAIGVKMNRVDRGVVIVP